MEFACNRINFKTVMATLTVAFFVGRISLFGGIFPAGIAFITVMLAVSTIYIYTLPVMALSVCLAYLQAEAAADAVTGGEFSEGGMTAFSGIAMDDPYGDIAAMILCGLFFLFFHRHRFTINQRTLIAIAITVVTRCTYTIVKTSIILSSDAPFPEMFNSSYIIDMNWVTIIQEILAVAIYIRVFNAVAAALLAPSEASTSRREKIGLSFAVLVISMTGAIAVKPVIFAIWFIIIALTAYCKDATHAIAVSAICDVFWRCFQGTSSSVFTSLYLALIISRFLVAAFEVKYRKYVLAAILFACIVLTTKTFDYSSAVSMFIFAAIPTDVLARIWHAIERIISPEEVRREDEQMLGLRQHLRKKRELFRSLGRMCSDGSATQRVLACQFEALARVTDIFLDESRRDEFCSADDRGEDMQVAVAGYAMGDVSGDSAMIFDFGGNRQGLILSDGMGKGEAAAPTSQMVVYTLSKLLEAGFDVDLALRTVNELLMAENDGEMFASLDMTVINKSNRRAHIFKMGASSTFIKHEGKVAIIKKPALPVGVTSHIQLEYLDLKLCRGDVLVMVSDGVTDCDRNDRECQWLIERMTEIGSSDPGVIAELIINKAIEKYGIKERDDLTVLVAVV